MKLDDAGLKEVLREGLPKHVLTDCAGLCYPAEPGKTVDILFGFSALARSARLRSQIYVAMGTMDKNEHPLAQRLVTTLESLSADSRARLFSNPLAEIDTTPKAEPDNPGNPGARQILSGVRHFIHHPDVRNITFIFPPCLFSAGPLYLPHVHAMLSNDAPGVTLAVAENEGKTHFVWSDGLSLTLVNNGSGLPAGFSHPRLAALPRVGGFPVLNRVAEVGPLLSSFGPAMDDEIDLGSGRIEAALGLLSQIWPLAFHGLTRHVKALCILKQRGHSRSHSPPELPGTIFMSADDIERIGDLLCHESSHIRMNIFRLYDAIARARDPDAEAIGFVSPWRPDLRPLRGLVDGVHAFLNVCRYHRRLEMRFPDARVSGAIYERQKRNVIQAGITLRKHAVPTPIGAMLLEEFAREEALL
ncbi:HEXXH motif-containing putative peptide modification protein [Nitrosospira sp. Nsp13]|uniref:aKG-HExxH-type peptide beta-hydroxylase n=1 Tax=Nitrosospira sp. Nsp13 TaxID=1855332 RepID=UPI00088F6942|nr:HEXXH motif-containing putative peptide modification protein [Nitrosospira sp. Nsp13]SCY30863.1 HEXXH motif-containing protein [Nitrosospira sp. Nsp13]